MHWFFLACLAPIFWGTTNYIDKLVLSRLGVHTGASTLMLFSSLISFVSVPVLLLCVPGIELAFTVQNALLIGTGICYSLGIWFYFMAMNNDETSIVVPFFQLLPVFTGLLGFIFLHETLSTLELLASAVVMAGALILTIDLRSGVGFRKKVAVYMLISCVVLSFGNVLFKYAAVEERFWISWFWEQVGLGVFGVILLFFRTHRTEFFSSIRQGSRRFLAANFANEVLTLCGNALARFASLLAPVALVMVVANSVQPIYVLMFGLVLTRFFPHILKEDITRKHVAQKVVAIIIMIAGTYWLNVVTV